MRFSGKTVVVTGAASGIGAESARLFAREGAIVFAGDIDAEGGAALAAEAEGDVRFQPCDVTDCEAIRRLMDRAAEETGGIDVLLNNAGAGGARAPIDEIEPADWDRTMDLLLRSVAFGIRYAVPHMLKAGWGRIVNLGGIGHHAGFLHRAHVHTAKAGLEGLTRGLAIEYADKGITVNCVAPGRIGGPRSKTAGSSAPNAKTPPTGFEGAPEDIAAAIRYVCSPDARFLTGQTIHVNGGQFLT